MYIYIYINVYVCQRLFRKYLYPFLNLQVPNGYLSHDGRLEKPAFLLNVLVDFGPLYLQCVINIYYNKYVYIYTYDIWYKICKYLCNMICLDMYTYNIYIYTYVYNIVCVPAFAGSLVINKYMSCPKNGLIGEHSVQPFLWHTHTKHVSSSDSWYNSLGCPQVTYSGLARECQSSRRALKSTPPMVTFIGIYTNCLKGQYRFLTWMMYY